jgi:hypothetical protein
LMSFCFLMSFFFRFFRIFLLSIFLSLHLFWFGVDLVQAVASKREPVVKVQSVEGATVGDVSKITGQPRLASKSQHCTKQLSWQ